MKTHSLALVAALSASLALMSPAAAEIYHLEGAITDGLLLTEPLGGGPLVPFTDFPLAYTATFNIQPASASATFQFIPLPDDDIDLTTTLPDNLFPGIVENDAAALVVDYDPPLQPIMNFFDLTLDKATGHGQWEWHDLCLLCDRPFDPFAVATITSFTVVPEPATVALIAFAALVVCARRRSVPSPS